MIFCARESIRQLGLRLQRVGQQPPRIAQPFAVGGDDAGVRDVAGDRRHPDVVAGPHVHLAAQLDAGHAHEVGPDRPAPGTLGIARQRQRSGEPRFAPVRGNDQASPDARDSFYFTLDEMRRLQISSNSVPQIAYHELPQQTGYLDRIFA